MGENKNSNSGILAKQKITMNETVREAIAQALIRLMKTTPFAQISISEIAKVAGVSRSSIYRNYDSKEQILHSHIHALYHSYFEEEKVQEKYPEKDRLGSFLLPRFCFIKKHREFFTVLRENNLLYAVFEQMNPELILLLGGQEKFESKYYFSMFAGAYAGIIGQWIKNDFLESEEEMVEIFSQVPFR